MSLLAEAEDRSFEAPQARQSQAIEAGGGPRAPWLASATAGLLAIALLSLAAGPIALEARAWLKQAVQAQASEPGLSARAVIVPAGLAAAAVLAATLLAHAASHGAWVRLGAWRRPGREPLSRRLMASIGGWALGATALAGGVAGALPWVGALGSLANRPLGEGAWAVAAFVASAAFGALIATLGLGLLQLRLRMREFRRTIRMTHAEAREAARHDAPAARRRPARRVPWRLA